METKNIEKLETKLTELFDKVTEKETIEQFGAIKDIINDIKTDQQSQQNEYNELLHNYKDVIIHQSYQPSNKYGQEDTVSFNFDQALDEFLQKNK